VKLFFALWPPPETARALGEWAHELQRQTGGRATRENSIHLTLAFLGEGDASKATAAARRVHGAAFDLPIEQARYWPHNRILWAGPHETPPSLAALAADLQLELYREQFILDRRPFAAHVTLLRKAGRPASLPGLPAVRWPASEFLLVSSTPTGAGSRYDVVQRFPLSAP
jgi:2'-5' RNA ligase